MSVCDVANCPVAALAGSRFCGVHKIARTARELHLGPNKEGIGAHRCTRCRRAFKDLDFVERQSVPTKRNRKDSTGYRHVVCAPASPRPNRKAIRESVKPLFDEASS